MSSGDDLPKNRRKGAEGIGEPSASVPSFVAKKRSSFWTRVIRFFKWATLSLCVVGLAAALYAWRYVRSLEGSLPDVRELKHHYKPPQVTRVLARDGTTLAELFTERRTLVSIDKVPSHVKLAVLAAEDASFYEHEGLNYWGIIRAAVVNVRSGHVRQGGSTITQQVVKNTLLDSERSVRRKVREALLARRLEQELSKDEILELYLNHIYFGHGRYGIEEASRDLFGKSTKDLTISEAALLSGIIACPETCTPRRDAKRALERRHVTLVRMLDKGFLKQAQFDAAKDEPLRLVQPTDGANELAPEAVQIARRMLHELAPEQAALGGFTIATTIDPRLQAAARKAVRDNLHAYDKRHLLASGLIAPKEPDPKKKAPKPAKDLAFEGTPSYESHRVYWGIVEGGNDAAGTIDVRVGTVSGVLKMNDLDRYNPQKLKASAFAQKGARVRVSLLAPPVLSVDPNKVTRVPLRMESGPEASFVALDVRTRDVLALVGNYEAQAGALDRATQSKRQPGSTFKPIVYSYALHTRKYTPATLIDVTPAAFGNYKPSNYEGWTAKDPLRLREVLAQSVNVGAVRVLDDVGPENVVAWARALGLTGKLEPDLSLALGSYEVEALELVTAYSTFAAGGMYQPSRIVTRITGPDGKDLDLRPLSPPRRVLEESEAYLITNMMTSVVDHGTASRAKTLGRPLAGKTGTTNGSKDAWFAGFSPEIAAISWVGYDDGKLLGATEAGGVTALPAWMSFMKIALEGRPVVDFAKPEGLVTVKIDSRTGKLPYPEDTEVNDEIFLVGTEPTEVSERAEDAGIIDGAPADAQDAGLEPLP